MDDGLEIYHHCFFFNKVLGSGEKKRELTGWVWNGSCTWTLKTHRKPQSQGEMLTVTAITDAYRVLPPALSHFILLFLQVLA